jgi:hypothetical protein
MVIREHERRGGHTPATLALAVDVRPRLLSSPDLDGAQVLVQGLVGVVLQLVLMFLTSFAHMRECERGTREQLLPHAVLGDLEALIVMTVMVCGRGVPIACSIPLLLVLTGTTSSRTWWG